MGIMALGGLLVAIGLATGVGGYLAPASVNAGLPTDSASAVATAQIRAVRDVAMALTLGAALASRLPAVLSLAFLMRLLTESQDFLVGLFTGATNGVPIGAYVGVFVVLIGLELWAVVSTYRLARGAAGDGSPAAQRDEPLTGSAV